MKKRLLSLVICIAVLLPTLVLFTSCGSEDERDPGSLKPMTIVIAMMTDEKTNEAGIEAAEKALNRITESNLKTHIELKLFTEDEYYAEVEKALLARRDAVDGGDKSSSLGDVEDVVFDEEKNREVVAFPEPYENQIDIFMVDSKAMLEHFRLWRGPDVTDEMFEEDPLNNTESLVSTLDDFLAESAPLLSKYLSANLLNAGKVYIGNEGDLCAIPSNAIYGDAEYMLIDKKYFDESSYNIDEVTNLVSLENYMIDFVAAHPDVQPIYNTGSMGFISLTGKNSIISQYVAPGATPDAIGLEPKTMLGAASFRNALISMQKYLPASDVSDAPLANSEIPADRLNNGSFAIGYLSASAEEIKAYEENYYVIESNKAPIGNEQACGNMFAVSEFTSDVGRCLEVINMIQTNGECRDALAYGELNVTYTVNENTGLVEREKEGKAVYLMDIHKTGNLFVLSPNSEMTETELAYAANDWALAKSASRHAFFSPYIGFELNVLEEDRDTNITNPTNLPTKAEIDYLEVLYGELMTAVFAYGDAVDENGEPLYATYAAYLDALDAAFRNMVLGDSYFDVPETEEPSTAPVTDGVDALDAEEPGEGEGEDTQTPGEGEGEDTQTPGEGEGEGTQTPGEGEGEGTQTPGEGGNEPPKVEEVSNADSKVVASQLVATAGMKNIYRQFLDWRKIRFVAAS